MKFTKNLLKILCRIKHFYVIDVTGRLIQNDNGINTISVTKRCMSCGSIMTDTYKPSETGFIKIIDQEIKNVP